MLFANSIKKMLIKKWAQEIVRTVAGKRVIFANHTPAIPADCKNIAGVGGSEFGPAFVSWKTLYSTTNDPEIKKFKGSDTAIKEALFFEYFAPLESWCDRNCQSPYYLWSDTSGIYRQFTDPSDKLLWNLSWEGSMPTQNEIQKLVLF